MFKLLFDVHQCSPVFFVTSLLDFMHRRIGIGELNCRRVDWIPEKPINALPFSSTNSEDIIKQFLTISDC